jgi:hypothetical protein
MNEQSLEEHSTTPSAQRTVAITHALAPPALIAKCLKGALDERPRKGQGRREARHSRRKRP